MKVGICCVGPGPFSTGDFVRRSAQASERAGFSSYWLGEHVLFFGAYPESPYPYAGVNPQWGDPPVPDPRVPFLDCLMGMAWAAAATEKLEVGSSIMILPQHNPVLLARELVTLDEFSRGRVTLGAGVGWCKEEGLAVGIDWANRGKLTDEYIAVMRALWRGDRVDFEGESVTLRDAYLYPKPVRGGDIPVMIGGDTDVALKRVARLGDGWLAFNLPVTDAAARIERLKALLHEKGRDPNAVRISTAIFSWTSQDDLARYRDAGVTEFLLFKSGELPTEDAALNAALAEAAHLFVHPVRSW
jgi:probable F420-dependent oxidoreductase